MTLFGSRVVSLLLLSAAAIQMAVAGEVTGRVTARGRPVRDAAVFIDGMRMGSAPTEPVVVDQQRRTFIPHVTVVMIGTTVHFPNNDTVFHNVFSFREGKPFDLGLYPVGKTKKERFTRPGLVKIYCNIHSNMSAFIWVIENPFGAVTNRKGEYRLRGVPAGTHTVRVWHEKLGERTSTLTVRGDSAVTLDLELK